MPDEPTIQKTDAGPDADLRRAVRRGLMVVVAAAAAGWAGSLVAARGPDAAGQRGVSHWRVPLDRAAVADLELLPGLGPTLALRLGAVCGEPAPTRPGDLMRVPRLGPTGRQRISPWVVFGAATAIDRGRAETPGPVGATPALPGRGGAAGREPTAAR